ncbi:hypothetical protein O0L34_g10276 [Tuta absoluta]|nr:hypothetical protein O0L34_g10276 [Tuta absoluta]
MVYLRIICLAVLATVASCEPPVQGYNYRRPTSFSAPKNQYLPPSSDYSAPPVDSYLPPSFGQTGQSAGYHQDHSHDSYNDHESYDNGHDHGHENEVPKSYEFGYSVKDAQSGNDYNRHETSDGNIVRGEYRVALPDGRTQIVTYHADWKTGFHADVRYEGEAHYPEPTHNEYNQQQRAGYNYNTPSDFSGSLTGFGANRNSYRAPSTAYGPPGYQ